MAQHIDGPLYYERMGRAGPVIAFIVLASTGQNYQAVAFTAAAEQARKAGPVTRNA